LKILKIERGGLTGQLRIKVDNMVPACCERIHGGNIADSLFYKRLSVRARRSVTRQREENE